MMSKQVKLSGMDDWDHVVCCRESDYGVMTNFRVEGVVYGRQVEGEWP